jgi:hypothetical protein
VEVRAVEVVTGTAVANIGERRFPAGVRISIQHIVRRAIRCGLNFETLADRGLTISSVYLSEPGGG